MAWPRYFFSWAAGGADRGGEFGDLGSQRLPVRFGSPPGVDLRRCRQGRTRRDAARRRTGHIVDVVGAATGLCYGGESR